MSNSNEPILSFQEVTFSYPGEKPLFRRFSFDLYKNEKIAIIGDSNRGKTTLINLIGGSLEPDSGQIVRNFEYPVYPQNLEVTAEGIYHKMDTVPDVYLLDEDIVGLKEKEREIFEANDRIAWQKSLLYIHSTNKPQNLDHFDKIIHLGPYSTLAKPKDRIITKG